MVKMCGRKIDCLAHSIMTNYEQLVQTISRISP